MILVSKPDALGDQLLATGFVQALRRRWPTDRIMWHVRDGMEVIAGLLEEASVFRPDTRRDPAAEAARMWSELETPVIVVPYGIHPFADWTPQLSPQYGWWKAFLRASRWELAVAPVVNRTGLSDFTVTASDATSRVGFGPNGAAQPMVESAFTLLPSRKADFTTEVPSSLQESEWTQLQRMLDGIIPGGVLEPPVLRISSEASIEAKRALTATAPLVMIAPGVGQHFARAWPAVHFAQVAATLAARGYEVRWIEGPHDATYFKDLATIDHAARWTVPSNRLDVLAAGLAGAALLLCNDTSYVHLAAALGTPTVAVFGAGQKARFVPPFGRVRVVQGDPVCRGCQWQCAFERLLCVQDVPVDAVQAAVDVQLSTPAAEHRRLRIPLPYPGAPDGPAALERVRDWFQEELDRLRWDGWARLQVIFDANERIKLRDRRIEELSGQPKSATAVPPPAKPSVLPPLSVIIPMGRPDRAEATFRSLEQQSLRPAVWEVIVVGVGASQLKAQFPQLPLVAIDLPHNLLPPRTRAEGVARASGEWFLFVDDDVRLAPDFFEMLARVLAVPHSFVDPGQPPVGAIGVRLPGGRGTFFEHLTDISNFWSQQSSVRAVPHAAWFLYSAAILIRAEAYRRAGGFNPELPNGEDVDLTQRITAAGYLLAYEPSLIAYHHHGRDSLFRMWRYFWRNGNTAQYFFGQLGGVCCFSVRTALVRAWRDLQMNREFQRKRGARLGSRLPWVFVNYLIFEHSLEWHYQSYLWATKRYREMPARTRSDRHAVAAFVAFEEGRRLPGLAHYALAVIQSFGDPVRR